RRGVELFGELLTRFPESQAKVRIVETASSLQMRRINPDLPWAEDLELRLEVLKLGRNAYRPPVQSQIHCQIRMIGLFHALGLFQEAFETLRELNDLLHPAQREHYNIKALLLVPALAQGHEELLPHFPFDRVVWGEPDLKWESSLPFHLLV